MFSNRASSPPEGFCAYQGLLWSGSLCCLWLRCCERSCALVRICQTSQSASKRVFAWNISFIPGPFIGNQRPGDLLIRVLCWSLFSERGTGEFSAGKAKIRTGRTRTTTRGGVYRVGLRPGSTWRVPCSLNSLAFQVFSSWPCHGWDLP